MSKDPRIADVILWQNGMVMVFDHSGQQIPEYQGKEEDVKEMINKVYDKPWSHKIWRRDGPGSNNENFG